MIKTFHVFLIIRTNLRLFKLIAQIMMIYKPNFKRKIIKDNNHKTFMIAMLNLS